MKEKHLEREREREGEGERERERGRERERERERASVHMLATARMPGQTCRSQRTAFESQISAFTLWVSGIELRSTALAASTFTQ